MKFLVYASVQRVTKGITMTFPNISLCLLQEKRATIRDVKTTAGEIKKFVSTLTIDSVSLSDKGRYTCAASSGRMNMKNSSYFVIHGRTSSTLVFWLFLIWDELLGCREHLGDERNDRKEPNCS